MICASNIAALKKSCVKLAISSFEHDIGRHNPMCKIFYMKKKKTPQLNSSLAENRKREKQTHLQLFQERIQPELAKVNDARHRSFDSLYRMGRLLTTNYCA